MTCGVQVARLGVRQRPGRHVRQAEPVHFGVQRQQLGRRHNQPRQRDRAAAEEQRCADPASERQAAQRRLAARRSTASVHPFGDGQRDVRAVARRACGRPGCARRAAIRSSQMPRTAGLGVRVEEQLDGVHHQPTRLATQRGSNAAALIGSNSAALIDPAPAGSTARTGASLASASRLRASAAPGSRGHAPITRPAHGIPWAASASSVSAVWFSVPRPGRDDDQHRRGQVAREVAQRHPVRAEFDQQAARALDQGQPAGRRPTRPTRPARRASAAPCPARCAAATGASGSG